jgi:uncharacterized membrane protein
MSASETTRTVSAGGANPSAPRKSAPGGRAAKAFALLALTLTIAGVAMSSYLAFENLQGESGVCTGVAHGCATVQQSPYGKILGVPVSVIGLGGYVLLAALAMVWLTDFRGGRAFAAFLGFNACLAAALFSAYLTYLEAFVINAWCIYCLTSAALVTLLFVTWALLLLTEVRAARNQVES